jgi:hypothetical protein
MQSDWDCETLLARPRGRRLCWEVLTHTGGWRWEEPPESAGAARLAAELAVAVARSDVGVLAVAREPASFFLALADAVTCAMYWQEPMTETVVWRIRASPNNCRRWLRR